MAALAVFVVTRSAGNLTVQALPLLITREIGGDVRAAGWLLGLCAALTGLGITYVQDMLPRQRGRASTLYSNTYPVGALIAGPVLGAAQLAGYRMPYIAAALNVVAFVLLTVARPRGRRPFRVSMGRRAGTP